MKTKRKNKIPKFKSEDEERDFWAKNSPLDFLDTSKVEFWELPNLKPTTEAIVFKKKDISLGAPTSSLACFG